MSNSKRLPGPSYMTVVDIWLRYNSQPLSECWGHRGASLAYPENTLASFTQAIADGADAIETDIHLSRDRVPLMFHDPDLLRTTGVKGTIKECDYYGFIDGLRTLKEPRQKVPTFGEMLGLLTKVCLFESVVWKSVLRGLSLGPV